MFMLIMLVTVNEELQGWKCTRKVEPKRVNKARQTDAAAPLTVTGMLLKSLSMLVALVGKASLGPTVLVKNYNLFCSRGFFFHNLMWNLYPVEPRYAFEQKCN
jgi:hypothetical protein